MDGGWVQGDTPFHSGEQQAQERMGVREQIDGFARRVVRDHMPDQHRAFYRQLPFVLLGTVDDQGRPWASLVPGRPGFMTSPDPRRLQIAAQPLPGDPLGRTLKAGAEVGLLGIELETRRRNRMTGRIEQLGADGFGITVNQAFGNCPQYIQARAVTPKPETDGTTPPVHWSQHFDPPTRALIERADTLFIATAYGDSRYTAAQGADVSHRGGKPGFVRLEGERSFLVPDFSGNNHFNTVGNLLLNPKAGFLFVDFVAGDLVYMTGAAEVVWQGAELRAFAGAERLIRFRADEVIRVEGSLPLRFHFGDYAPQLAQSGSWAQAAETIAADRARDRYAPYEIFEVQAESETITSFYLRRPDGEPLADYLPGQFLPIRLSIPGQVAPLLRTYTLSAAPNGAHYRLSIKRKGGDALVSTFLHDRAGPGFRLEAMAPRGKFALDPKSQRPVALISGGVGITPMIAMATTLVDQGRPTTFIHGTRNGREHAFADQIRELAAKHDGLRPHIRYSQPGAADRLGDSHHSEGHVDKALLKSLLPPLDQVEVYLCGPQAFMQSLYTGLTELAIDPARIHYESFGPATLLKPGASSATTAERDPVSVAFAASGASATWTPDQGTLLDLAEAAGLEPAFACRSGICGTCATRLACGEVDYLKEPTAPHADDQVLICCATPRPGAGTASSGRASGIVLDL